MSTVSRTSRLLICPSALTMLAATLVSIRFFFPLRILGIFFADEDVIDSTALLIGEKCAMLVAEDLGYSGEALEMKVPNYHAPGELSGIASLRL